MRDINYINNVTEFKNKELSISSAVSENQDSRLAELFRNSSLLPTAPLTRGARCFFYVRVALDAVPLLTFAVGNE